MIELADILIYYFQAPVNYFWNWADKGEIIAWKNNFTICYREDLLNVLQQLRDQSIPELSPILLLFSACTKTFDTEKEKILLDEALKFIYERDSQNADADELLKLVNDAVSCLKIISSLPENLRTGKSRVQLIHIMFGKSDDNISNAQVQDAILRLNSGQFDTYIFQKFGLPVNEITFKYHLSYFAAAFKKYPTVQHLVVKLRTGLDQLPEPAGPEIEEPAENILDQLMADPKTHGLAALAKRLIAAIHIPMQSKGSSDQPFGGISDITNRGNYDKLLLTELGYDDEMLMARLVNNEALYFRREQPPQQPKLKRIILLDTTLKMWGTSRVFALAAGLASAQQQKHFSELQAYCLGGTTYTAVNLLMKTGVIQALEKLDPALHCGPALESVVASFPAAARQEIIFITDSKLLHNPAFNASLSAVKHTLSFVIAVSAGGEIFLYEYINGTRKQIGFAKVDADNLLATRKSLTTKKTVNKSGESIPLFLSQKPAALYFSPVRLALLAHNSFKQDGGPLITVSKNQRLYLIRNADRGAIELLPYIEKGTYEFSFSDDGMINVSVADTGRHLLKLYRIDPDTTESKCIDLAKQVSFFTKVLFRGENLLMIVTNREVWSYDYIAEVVTHKEDSPQAKKFFDLPERSNLQLQQSISRDKFYINPPGIFYRIQKMYVNEKNQLVVGEHALELHEPRQAHQTSYFEFGNRLRDQKEIKKARHIDGPLNLTGNKRITFNKWEWKDGSIAMVDSRGLLHLKSSNPNIPEIAVVMISGRNTACWASDGTTAGVSYFINDKISRKITPQEFYNLYIQLYIDHLL